MLGYIDAIIYCVFTAVSFVFIDKMGDHINPYLSLFVMTLIACIFFISINYKHLKLMGRTIIDNKTLYLIMCHMVGINWLCSIFAPHLADPFIYLSVLFIVTSILGLIFIPKKNQAESLVHCALSIILMLLIIFIFMKYNILDGKNISLGIILGIIAGVTTYLYGLFSNKLSTRSSLSPSQVLGIRFIPLIIVLSIIIFQPNSQIEISLKPNDSYIILFMAFISLIIPAYFLQVSFKKIGVMESALILGLIPGISFALYSIAIQYFIWINFFIALITTAVLILVKILPKLISKKLCRWSKYK